jgi:hypothetical protein
MYAENYNFKKNKIEIFTHQLLLYKYIIKVVYCHIRLLIIYANRSCED